MSNQSAVRAHRSPVVTDEPLVGHARYDYADAFEIRLGDADPRSAEQFARSALEEAPWPLRWTIRLVHRRLLRFRLGPRSSPDHLLGWTIITSKPDVIQLQAVSPLLRAVIVSRRLDLPGAVVTTYLFYRQPVPARVVWTVVGPLHRRVAAYLLEHAARRHGYRPSAARVLTEQGRESDVTSDGPARNTGVAIRVSTVVGVDEVPRSVRSLTSLADPDYIDLFTVTTPGARNRSPDEWARAVLEQTPLARRNARVLWRLMGLRLGPQSSPDHVQGWRISARGDNWLRAETASWYMTAQAVCLIEEGSVSASLSLRYDHPVAVLVWAVVSASHQRAMPIMLRQAVKAQEPNPARQDSSPKVEWS
jgi:hypothetical protein